MKTSRCLFTAYLAGLTSFFLAAAGALAINVAEPIPLPASPDFSNSLPGTAYTLTLGANTFSGSVNTTGGVDGQDNFQVTVPAGLRITAVSKNVTAVGGPAFSGFVAFNGIESLSGTGVGNFTTGLPFSAGFYQVTVAANFSVGNPWSVTVTTGPAPDYSVSTTGGVITVTDDAGNGDVLTVTEPVAGQINFAAPGRTFAVNGGALIAGDSGNLPLAGVTSIQVNAAAGNDTINVPAFSGTSFPDLQISGGPDDDTVNLNGDITFATNASLGVSAETAIVAANVNLLVSKAGTIFVTCRRNVSLASGSSLETENGTLSVQANQQTTAVTGNFTGVNLNGATLRSTGTGAVTVKGRGGDDAGGSQLGVGIFSGAKIIGGSGAVNVTGTGGASTNWINRGVTVYGAGSQITSTGGAVSVTGTAGALGSFYGIGISLLFGGEISAGGAGTVSVSGTGGGASASGNNMGVEVSEPASRITSAGGNVTVTGTAGVGASWGVYLANSGAISAPVAGGNVIVEADSISLDGTSTVSSAAATSTVTLQTHNTITRLNLGGADDNAGPPKVLGLTDAEIDRITTPTLILSSASFSTLTISAPITPANATNLTLNTTDANSPIKATVAGTDITLLVGGVLKIDSPLAMPITSATPDTGFPQLKVVGGVNLNGKALDLTGTTFAGALGQTFTIIDNDGTDAVTGTFAGLPQNATLPWPPNPALSARVSYTGGSGNDVTLTIVDVTPPVITVPSNITQTATSPAGRVVFYAASASDGGGLASFTALPSSGSTFPIGVTTVALNAQDNAGNTASASFTVTVVDPRLVTSTASDTSAGSLRAALTAVESWSGPDTITFAPALSGQTITLGGEIVIADNDAVTIDASNLSAGLTISGGNTTRLFSVASGKSLTLKNLTLTAGNGAGATSGGSGGAIYNTGAVTLVRCTLSGNSVGFGGGAIRSVGETSSLTMENCTVAGNSALFGGAVWHDDGAASFVHCTIARNTGTGGTGGLVLGNGTATFHNTLVAENTGTADPDMGGAGTALTLNGSNLFGQPGNYAAALPPGLPNAGSDYVGTPAAPLNPRLGPLANNGGPTQTLALLPGSPALDKAVVVSGLATDQRGLIRSRDADVIAGALPDIGAYEAQAAPFSVGFNFIGGGTNGPGGTLTSTEVAGLFPQANWNNLSTDYDGSSNGTAPNAPSRNDATGASISGLKLWWDAPTLWSSVGTPTTPNEKLLWGYLDSNGNVNSSTDLYVANNQPFFAIASLPSAVTLGGYRVLVYADGDSNDHVSEFWLASNRGTNPSNVSSETDLTTHRFRRDNTDGSALVEVPATSTSDLGVNTPVGNVLRFDAMTEPGFTVRSAENAFGAFARAEINAVQVVRNEIVVVTTAADELDPVGTLGTGISLREALRDAPDGAGIVFDSAVFNGEPADTITFLAANPGLVVAKNLTIDASNISGGVTVNAAASNTNQKSVFTVNSGKTAAMLGLNITGGYIASGLESGIGGGVVNQGTTALTDCRLSGNTAQFGAAAVSYSGPAPARLTLRRCTVSGNTARETGGGLINWARSGSAADLRMEDCAVTGNTAVVYAGGLYNAGSIGTATLVVLRTTISGNSAASAAGVFNLSSGPTGICTATLTHCTVSGNIAGAVGGGCYSSQGSGTATLTLADTIVAGNSASSAGNGPDIFKQGATTTSLGGNLIGKTDASGTTWLGSDLTGTAATPLDPLLAPLGNYGGPTQTMALLFGSPARNAAVGSAPTSDQRGFPIVGVPDIGAYEAGTFTDYDAWIWETLPTSANPAAHAPTFDNDRDGRNNALEYATLGDPSVPNGGLVLPFTRNAAGTLATIVMPYRFSAPDLVYTIERSTNLTGAWTPIVGVNSATNGLVFPLGGVAYSTNDGVSITFTDTFIAGKPQVFYRLRVNVTAP